MKPHLLFFAVETIGLFACRAGAPTWSKAGDGCARSSSRSSARPLLSTVMLWIMFRPDAAAYLDPLRREVRSALGCGFTKRCSATIVATLTLRFW